MHGTEAPSPWLLRHGHLLPQGSHVLDLACGAGRHMRWLAEQGHTVLGVDRSADALATAGAWGRTLLADIEAGHWPLQGQTFDAVVVTHYLWRPLWPHILASLAPGAILIYETFSQGQETVGRPSRPEFLLASAELLDVARQGGLRVIAFEEGFMSTPDRFMQRIVAARPDPQAPSPVRWALA